MIRGIIISVIEGVIKRFSSSGRDDEEIDDRELFQHYGFTSRPLPGAENIIIHQGNIYFSIAEDDRRYRLAVESGEVALYTDEGDKIHLKRNKTIEIVSGNKLIATVENEVDITTKTATINASESCTVTSKQVNIDAPIVNISGNVKIAGNAEVGSGASGVLVDLTGSVFTVQNGIIIDIR